VPNILTITVENPDELLDIGLYGAGAVVQVQSGSAEAGPFADDGTVAIVAATRSYTYYDVDGISSTWYRTRYENAAGTTTSDWTAAFQTGDETAGLLCSVYDVEQELGRTLTANERESVIDKIRQVSMAIEGYTGRWFVPRPLSGTTTYRFHTRTGTTLRIPKGIRSITTLGTATGDQPTSGGTYATTTGFYLDPPDAERDVGWPATTIRLLSTAGVRFYRASFGAEVTGAFGWASVPHDIQGVAIRAVVRRYLGKGGGGTTVAVGPAGTPMLLPDMSGADRAVLAHYRSIPV
jgi:hypothetical protein